MPRLNRHVFDQYDDGDGQVLRSIVHRVEDIPDFVKTSSMLTPEQHVRTSDDQFALVMIEDGGKLRKYAMVDKGQTALSVLYLLKQAHLLPPQAVKVAASNLIHACLRHELSVPEQLKIAAQTGMSPVSGKSHLPYAKGAKVSKIQFPVKEPPKESLDNPQLGKADGANDDVKDRTNLGGVPGTNMVQMPTFPQKEHEPMGKLAGAFGDADGEVRTKQQQWKTSPYVDMSGWDPSSAAYGMPQPAARETLVEGHYPIDGYDQVKMASAYFEENWREFDPRRRHEYCVKLASRMEKLGMAVPEDISRYGSETYAADVDSYVEARRGWVKEEFYPALETLLEKRAQVSPGTFAEALEEFDNMTGLRWHWGAQIADPWYSTFGPSLEKVAELAWCYSEDGARCDEDDLKALAMNGHTQLVKAFGADFAKEFAKSPKTFFNALPAPNKKILARMAMDRSGAGETV